MPAFCYVQITTQKGTVLLTEPKRKCESQANLMSSHLPEFQKICSPFQQSPVGEDLHLHSAHSLRQERSSSIRSALTLWQTGSQDHPLSLSEPGSHAHGDRWRVAASQQLPHVPITWQRHRCSERLDGRSMAAACNDLHVRAAAGSMEVCRKIRGKLASGNG